ncbi:MAG: hypothetical protein CMB96_04755 [Flavobacteriaceae bacterium]|nr:hypothetical protein [Flavobacteriaceae bacterium]
MSSLTQGLDNLSLRIRGENGQYQEGWSSRSFEEGITKLFYQLVRVNKKTGSGTLNVLNNLYTYLVNNAVKSLDESQINFLTALLFQTRDISGGKGEYALFYNLLPVWEPHFHVPMVSNKLTPLLVLLVDTDMAKDRYGVEHVHSYGSWKDFKYILETFKDNANMTDRQAIERINQASIPKVLITLVKEKMKLKNNNSLISRWLPREKSKFGWQAKVLAPLITPRATTESSLRAYRKKLAELNKQLGTVQVNQCANTWANIDFSKDCTSITMSKQKKAFMCEGTNSDAKNRPDRTLCSENYLNYLQSCKTGEKKIKSARTSPGSMVKEFWTQYTSSKYGTNYMSQSEKDTNNLMWKQQQEDSGSVLTNCVPILDTSGSMTWENCPLYDATAIALKIAENSTIGKRVMTFSQNPTWINLEGKDTLEEMVTGIIQMSHSVGTSTNMESAFKLLCDACVHKDMTPEEVEDIVLVVLSDMQADQGSRHGNSILEEIVQKMFHEAGLKTSHKRPYSAPTMVWWNMRTTNGAPCSTTSKNTVMMSGYDASVLSSVMESGIDTLKQLTAWDNLKKLLSSERYSWTWNY